VGGRSEEIIGRWLSARPGVRDSVVVATKGRFPTGPGPNGLGLSRQHLSRALDGSLRRLGVDTIDLYQLHGWDPLTSVQETLRFLDDAVRAGKINYVGLSNFTAWQIQKYVDLAEAGGLSSGPVAIAWLLARPAVTSVILGARTLTQLNDNLAAADQPLDDDEIRRLNEASEPDTPDYPYGEKGQPHRRRTINPDPA
jgi:aryl-alcohol dehydrogenase-like predicted oxidoreductase